MRKSDWQSTLCAILLLPTLALANPQDFAYLAKLSDSDQNLQHFQLPIDILITTSRSDLGDIAVFDASGKSMARTILLRAPEYTSQQQELKFHQFDSYRKNRSKTVTTREQSEQQGQLSELQTTETIDSHSISRDYLIELPHQQAKTDWIELQWTHQPEAQLLELKVEVGNDIDRLRVLYPRKNLSNLDQGDPKWRRIEGIPANNKYLRLTAVRSINTFNLGRVSAQYREAIPITKATHLISPAKTSIDQKTYYRFDLPSALQAESFRILPTTDASIIVADVYSGSDEFKNKHRIGRRIKQHNITGTDVRPSSPIKLPGGDGNTRYWFSTQAELVFTPQVELIYPAYELVFLGNGKKPYRVAWGNFESPAVLNGLSGIVDADLRDQQQRGTRIIAGMSQVSGGPARLVAPVTTPWQKWLLWLLLIVAVAVTGKMALGLYRQINSQNSNENNAEKTGSA